MTTPQTGVPILAHQPVMVLWGNRNGAIHIGTTDMNLAMGLAMDWFRENDHFFHLEYFPPYHRMWGDEKCVTIDYGSHANFIFCIPA